MKLTKKRINEMLANAAAAGVCEEELAIIRGLSVDEILKHEHAPYWACWYALNVSHCRFEQAEAAIAQDAYWSYRYARNVLHGRFEQGEASIAQSACWSYWYAKDVYPGSKER